MKNHNVVLHETENFIINYALDHLKESLRNDPDTMRKPLDKMIEMCTDYSNPDSWIEYVERTKNKFNHVQQTQDEKTLSVESPSDRQFLEELLRI